MATWCGPCIREIPRLKELQSKIHEADLLMLSISSDDQKTAWKRGVGNLGMTRYQYLI